MAAPVVVSRIQNRRGTQAQFDALYPVGYTGVGGYGDPNFPGFDSTNYPNVLLPGEIALCTDTRAIFIGNLNAEYVSVGFDGTLEDLIFIPAMFILPPSATFVPLTGAGIYYAPVPFFTIEYSATDSNVANWNSIGDSFSRNGELRITALADPYTTLTDIGAEINLTSSNISFQSVYSGGAIELQYMHDFPGPIIFSTATIQWVTGSTPPVTYPTFDSSDVTFDSTVDTFDEGP